MQLSKKRLFQANYFKNKRNKTFSYAFSSHMRGTPHTPQ